MRQSNPSPAKAAMNKTPARPVIAGKAIANLCAVGLAALGFVAAGCSGGEVAAVRQDLGASVGGVAAACSDALAAARLAQANVKGGAANTAASIAGYVTAGCTTAAAVAALAANSSSLQWLGEQQGALEALAASPAAAPAPVEPGNGSKVTPAVPEASAIPTGTGRFS